MNMFAVWDGSEPDTENIKGLNFAVVKLPTIQVTTLPLYDTYDRLNLFCKEWADRRLVI
jgi:hypothetical protein